MKTLLHAFERYNTLASHPTLGLHTWQHMNARQRTIYRAVWLGMAERLLSEAVRAGLRGQNADFTRGRINDSLRRAGRSDLFLGAGWCLPGQS